MYRAAASLASKARAASSSGRMIGSRLAWSRNYAAKDIRFGVEARPLMLRSVQELADAVKVTMGPKILGYEKTFSRCFSVGAQGEPASQPSIAEKKTVQKVGKVVSGVEGKVVVEPASHVDGKKVTCFSPLEAISIKPRTGSLANESLKIKRTELSQKITFALIPALLLISKTPLTTSILVLSVYWQIHVYFKEIFLDYVHQEVTLKWVMVYFNILLLILVKDTFLDFGLV